MDQYQEFIAKSRYARWLQELRRREEWHETVGRYISFFAERNLPTKMAEELFNAIHSMEVMPSMRCMMTAGAALERDNVAGYNCAYVAIDHPRAFDETMFILMCGTGVGFSVERQYVSRLPTIPDVLQESGRVLTVRDSKIGWATSFKRLINGLYHGKVHGWDVSNVRPAGAPLKTFGGRASGPEPLEDLFRFTIALFKGAHGRKLNSLECHDLICKVADIVVCGGVRRSALISLSNLSDDRLRTAKSGEWSDENPQRALANNSACYTERPELGVFMKEWMSLYESKSGERGIFSRAASQNQVKRIGRRNAYYEFGTNPCSEIILRSCQFCNLSEVVVRSGDTLDDLKRKVRLATILGTLQSTLTNFRYLRKIWSDNTAEERLLGVSLTGIMDHRLLGDASNHKLPRWLEELKGVAIATNKEWAKKLGIPCSTAITCVKPSGTVSQLVNSASGIHSRFSPFYTRTVRADIKDPLTQLLKDAGVPYEPCKMNPVATVVFSFPQMAPEGAHCVKDDTAIGQLELWKVYQDHWCEHKPSITVYYSDEEFLGVGDWVYKNFDNISGVSFLPRADHVYEQAPYQEISVGKYAKAVAIMPEIPWDKLSEYEQGVDTTKGSQTMACTGSVCEVVDI